MTRSMRSTLLRLSTYTPRKQSRPAEAGKQVLCEKPMALNVEECDRMIAAAGASGVKLGVSYYRHFYPVLARVKAILEAGEIGTPVIAQMNTFRDF